MDERRERIWDSPTKELGRFVDIPLDAPFVTQHGAELEELLVCYESWGERNAAGDNVVLLVHPMTADPHATGEYLEQERGFWEELIGPGRVLDTDRYHVVCPNLLGSCYGTTGPSSPGPGGGPWLDSFPLLTPRDMMRAQKLFLDAIGVDRVALVIGPSMGGMITWEWAIEHPDLVDAAVVIAAPLVTTAYQIGLNWLQRRGIELDIDGDEVARKFGQMIARGIGMLSYRSHTGLEERFGREWFQKPGNTLKKRGMFNIESWLRFHGKRIVKRFDPYTYLLFSRAMDLHDVGEGRDDLNAALARVRSRMLVLGISSDNLYPPEEVHFGADLLQRLGGDVQYREIRSLHGHDAFLLETEQIEGFLREFLNGDAAALPTASEREARLVRVGLLGGGRVATELVQLLRDRADSLLNQHRLRIEIAGVCDIDPGRGAAFEGCSFSTDPRALVRDAEFDVLIELTPELSNHELVAEFLASGRSVVTPNKRLVREHGEALDAVALRNAARLAYHDSIAAGWPMLSAMERPLLHGNVRGIRAILSATCNQLLQSIEEGQKLEDALVELQAEKLSEPDPSLDIDGWDTAQKLSILITRALGQRVSLPPDHVTGIGGLDPEFVRATHRSGRRLRLVALAELGDATLRACVRPMAVPADGHLGSVRGRNHVVVLETEEHGELVQLGQGGGTLPVAVAVLNDLVGLMDPKQSWTGRFPLYRGEVAMPRVSRWFGMDGRGDAVPFAEAGPGSVPLLQP